MKNSKRFSMTTMKKSIVLFMTIIVVFSFSACANQDNYIDETKQTMMDVYNCLLDGDSEKLKSLFSKKMKEDPNIDSKISTFMDSIGGCISSGDLDSYHYDVAYRQRDVGTDFGDYDALTTLAEIDDIMDNNGTEYKTLGISYQFRYKKDTDQEGLRCIILSEDGSYPTYIIAPDEE